MKATYLSADNTDKTLHHIIKVDQDLYEVLAKYTAKPGDSLYLQPWVMNARELSYTREKLSVAIKEVYACLMIIIGWAKP